jgi:hypothetical protein
METRDDYTLNLVSPIAISIAAVAQSVFLLGLQVRQEMIYLCAR